MYPLTASYRAYNFEFIVTIQHRLSKIAARHNLAVTFYRQTLASEAQMLNKLGHGQTLHLELPGVTVDGQMNQLRTT